MPIKLAFAVVVLFTAFFAHAESRGDQFVKQADAALESKEYVKARYCYLKAFDAYNKESQMDKAIPAAVNVASLYHRESYYKEAFEMLTNAELSLNEYEKSSEKQLPGLHYPIARERQRMYLKLRKADSARDHLERMATWASAANDSALNVDLLSARANVYYTFGQNDKGDEAVNKLIALYLSANDYDKANKCYKDLIDMAVRSGNVKLTVRAYEKYVAWADSVAAVKADARYAALQKQYDDANATIADRDSSLTAKSAIIIGLIVLAAALAAALIFVSIGMLRYMALSRRQKKAIATAREHNELKNQFIANISAQMEPTLDTLPADLPAAKALKEFAAHIQRLSDLEATQTELYPTEDVNMSTFCESLAEATKSKTAPDVTVSVNAPKMSAPVNEEELGKVLGHLLSNAAEYTPAGGKITLDFKKRGPHNIQFIITDTGCGIAEEERDDLFKPFATVRDLTKGDGLGLPMCALSVAKMNGTLRLDDSYSHGTRFIVELHP